MNDIQNINSIVEVFETKLDQLIQSVKEIKETIHDNSVDISNLKLEINTFKNKTEQQQKEIDKLYEKNEKNKNWIMGIVASVGAGLVLAVVKFFVGI